MARYIPNGYVNKIKELIKEILTCWKHGQIILEMKVWCRFNILYLWFVNSSILGDSGFNKDKFLGLNLNHYLLH